MIAFFVFSLILFLYLHVQFHLKTSDNLEIYEIDQASKDKMEEICDLRQPVLFDSDEDGIKIINTTNKNLLLENYPVFEIKIRDNLPDNSESQLSVPLPFHIASKLFNQDEKSIYFSENNLDFLQETGAIKNMTYNDEFLRPYLVSNCYYDVLMGSNNVETPFRYELNYRNYFIVTQGSIQIKLAPPKSGKYLYPINDFENFESWVLNLGEESAILSRDEEEKSAAIAELQKLVDEHFPAGVDGSNAIESLKGVIFTLFKDLKEFDCSIDTLMIEFKLSDSIKSD